MTFEWDAVKNEANIGKHGIDFDEARLIFAGDVYEYIDDRNDYGEIRIAAIGEVAGRELTVIYTLRGESRRIISARRARRDERRAYREAYPG